MRSIQGLNTTTIRYAVKIAEAGLDQVGEYVQIYKDGKLYEGWPIRYLLAVLPILLEGEYRAGMKDGIALTVEESGTKVHENADGSVFCLRCGYAWEPHVEIPAKCAGCKSKLWNVERVRNPGAGRKKAGK